jgi:ribosome-binding protein aMBF1 (putative translation factor)
MRIDAYHASRVRRDAAYRDAVVDVESDPREFFAARIASLRARAGLSQADLASLALTTQAVVSRLESAVGNPKLGTIQRVLDALRGRQPRPGRGARRGARASRRLARQAP